MTKTRLTKINRRTVGFLMLAVAVTCLAAFYRYIFCGDMMAFTDIGSDTTQQYLTQYATIISKIRQGDWSLWNEYYGFGANMYMLNLFNPLLMILYGIGALAGFQVIPRLMIWWYIGEILLSAFSAYVYLSVFRLDEKAKAIASYMFAFNGFLIVWGQHYQFGIVCILFPLLLWTIERMLRNMRCWPALVVVSAFVTLNSMYLAYMMFLCAAFYVIFRILMRERLSFGKWFKKVFLMALPMVLGLAIGAISLLPSYAAIANVSARLNSNLSILGRFSGAFSAYPGIYYKTLISRFFTSTGEGINIFDGYLNYYEAPCVFFTTLFVILGAQYVFTLPGQKSNRRQKLFQVLFLILAAAGLYFPAAGVLFNGLTTPFSRYTFLYMPYFLLISAFTLERMLKERKISLIALALSAGLIMWRYSAILTGSGNFSRKVMLALWLTGIMLTASVLTLRFAGKEKLRKYVTAALLLSLAANACVETYGNFSSRDVLKTGHPYFDYLNDEDTIGALELIRSSDKGSYRIEKVYGATISMDSLFFDYQSASVYNSTQNRYVIDYVNSFWPTLQWLDQNHYDFEEATDYPDEAALVGVKYILLDTDDDEGDTIPEGYELWHKVGSVEIYRSTTVESLYTYYDEGSYTGDEESVTVSYKDRDETAVIDLEDKVASDENSGTVTVSEDGVLFSAIPYEDGWTTYVDGEEAVTLLADKGFQGVYLTAGTHQVSIVYQCPLFKEGAMVTLVGLLVFAMLLVVRKRRLTGE